MTAVAAEAPETDVPGGEVDAPSPDQLMTPCWGRLAVEGVMTGDEREFLADALRWDFKDGPLPYRWCPEDYGAHQGAYHVAWIDDVQRVGADIMWRGRVFDQRFRTYLELAGRCGTSVDCDDETFTIVVPPEDVVPGPDGGEFEPAFQQQIFSDARIRGATAVDFGAIVEAFIVPGEPPAEGAAPVVDDTPAGEAAVPDGSPGLAAETFAVEAPSDVAAVVPGEGSAAAPTDTVTHAGLGVLAEDTGRILLLQRAHDPEDPAAGRWEFPGGSIDDGESPLDAARREFSEETGLEAPAPDPSLNWVSPDGVYQCFIVKVPAEADLALNPDTAAVVNPDDPNRDVPEVTAWYSLDDLAAMDAPPLRDEVAADPHWGEIAALLDTEEAPMTDDTLTAAAEDAPVDDAVPEPPEVQYIDVRVSSRHGEFLDAFVGLCQSIEYLSGVGASRTLTFDVDGDGAADLKFDYGDTQVPDQPPITEDDLGGDEVHVPGIVGSILAAHPDELDNLIASAAPVEPPAEWFQEIDFAEKTPLTITPEGRVFGIFAPKDGCHAGDRYKGTCQPPPVDPNPEYFHLGQVLCDDGSLVDVGRMTVGGGHADINLNLQAALEHYDDASTCVAVVHAYETKYGGAVVGSVVSEATPSQIAALRRSPVSGDWRQQPGRGSGRRSKARRLIGIHAVNVPGFAVVRSGGSHPLGLVASISPQAFISGGQIPETCGECGGDVHGDGLVAAIAVRSQLAAPFEAYQNERRSALRALMSAGSTSEITEEGT